MAALLVSVESDLSEIAVEARNARSDGFAGHIQGLFSTGQHKDVTTAAERAELKLRSIAKEAKASQLKGKALDDFVLGRVRDTQEVLDAHLMACGKTKRMTCQALGHIQKLVSNDALAFRRWPHVIKMLMALEKVRGMDSEEVRLKMLQTSLALLQPDGVCDEVSWVRAVLSLCFRILTAKATANVINTAAATVRQAMTLVMQHLQTALPRLLELPAVASGARAEAAQGDAPPLGDEAPAAAAAPGKLPGRLVAATKMLEELCNMARQEKPAAWLSAPAPSRGFLLDTLHDLMEGCSDVFLQLPQMQALLRESVCNLLTSCVLQPALDPAADPLLAPELKLSLRCCTVVLLRFHHLLPLRINTILSALLAGCGTDRQMWQRVYSMQTIVLAAKRADLVHFLYRTFDARLDYDLNALYDMVSIATVTLDSYMQLSLQEPEEEMTAALGTVYAHRVSGRDSADVDAMLLVDRRMGEVLLACAAVQALLALISSLEKLADLSLGLAGLPAAQTADSEDGAGEPPAASRQGSADAPASPASAAETPPARPGPSGSAAEAEQRGAPRSSTEAQQHGGLGGGRHAPLDAYECSLLFEAVWQKLLEFQKLLIRHSVNEALVLSLLRSLQCMTQSCGMLEMVEARNEFLAALCEFTMPADAPHADSATAGPAAAAGVGPAGSAAGLMVAGAAGEAGSDGIILLPKNVQALRTLFNVAHRLCNTLGPSWMVVLETLDKLDRILLSPRTTTQEVSSQSLSAPPSDLAILSTAADQLYQSTVDMELASVMAMYDCLQKVSSRSVPALARSTGAIPRLFGMSRMVDILLHNVARSRRLWAVFFPHALQVATASSSSAAVRSAALDQVDRAVTGLLPLLSQLPAASGQGEGAPAEARQPSDDEAAADAETSEMQQVVLSSLHQLYSTPGFSVDGRERCVNTLLHVLQDDCDHLSSAWTSVLDLLQAVPFAAQPSMHEVRLGNEGVQRIIGDHWVGLPVDCMQRCLEVAAQYGVQQTDTNTCYAATTTLWRAADQLGRALKHLVAARPQAKRPPPERVAAEQGRTPGLPLHQPDAKEASKDSAALAAKLGEDSCKQLLVYVLQAARRISMDNRPEVRSGGVHMFFDLMTRHSSQLASQKSWLSGMWGMSFPLLRNVFEMASTSSQEETSEMQVGSSSRAGGTQRQRSLRLHHSRNSMAKQWQETLVKAVRGMAAVLRTHLPAVAQLPNFNAAWDELMQLLEQVLTGVPVAGGGFRWTGRDAAVAAAQFFTTALPPHLQQAAGDGASAAPGPAIPPQLWRRAYAALEHTARRMSDPGTAAHVSAREEFVKVVAALYQQAGPAFDLEQTIGMWKWWGWMARSPVARVDMLPPTGIVTLSQLQRRLLDTVPSLAPPVLPAVWPRILSLLSSHLDQQHLDLVFPLQQSAAASPKPPAADNDGLSAWSRVESMPTVPSELEEEEEEEEGGGGVGPSRVIQAGSVDDAVASNARDRGAARVSRSGSQSSLDLRRGCSEGAGSRTACDSPFTTCWMEEVVAALEVQYNAAPEQVKAESFAVVLCALARCIRTRWVDPQGSLWVAASSSFCRVVSAGIIAVNIAFVNRTPPPTDTWQALAESFEVALLSGESAGDVPRANGEAGSSGTGPAEGRRASRRSGTKGECEEDGEGPEAALLEALTDTVLTACSYTPPAQRLQLVTVVDRGVAAWRGVDAHRPRRHRLGLRCLWKLRALSCRGLQSPGAGHSSLLEIAQIALPVFVDRCARMLTEFAEEDQRSRAGLDSADVLVGSAGADGSEAADTEAAEGALPSWRVEEVLCVMEVLVDMEVPAAVMNSLVASRPSPQAALLQLLRRHRSSGSSGAGSPAGGFLSDSESCRNPAGESPGLPSSPLRMASLVMAHLSPAPSHSRSASGLPAPASTANNPHAVQGGTDPAAVPSDGFADRSREQLHLLLLYEPLVRCASCPHPEVRCRLQALLLRIGALLGLSTGLAPPTLSSHGSRPL